MFLQSSDFQNGRVGSAQYCDRSCSSFHYGLCLHSSPVQVFLLDFYALLGYFIEGSSCWEGCSWAGTSHQITSVHTFKEVKMTQMTNISDAFS